MLLAGSGLNVFYGTVTIEVENPTPPTPGEQEVIDQIIPTLGPTMAIDWACDPAFPADIQNALAAYLIKCVYTDKPYERYGSQSLNPIPPAQIRARVINRMQIDARFASLMIGAGWTS